MGTIIFYPALAVFIFLAMMLLNISAISEKKHNRATRVRVGLGMGVAAVACVTVAAITMNSGPASERVAAEQPTAVIDIVPISDDVFVDVGHSRMTFAQYEDGVSSLQEIRFERRLSHAYVTDDPDVQPRVEVFEFCHEDVWWRKLSMEDICWTSVDVYLPSEGVTDLRDVSIG